MMKNSLLEKLGAAARRDSFTAKSKTTINGLLVLFALLLMNTQVSWGQTLLVDNFSGNVGTALTANGWTLHSGTATPFLISSPALTYSSYTGSGIGNSASTGGTSDDINKSFTSTNTGSLYMSFMYKPTSASTTTDYSVVFGNAAGESVTGLFGKFYVQRDVSSNLRFGITKTTAASASYTGYSYALNTTYLIVIRYDFVAGTTNDVAYLFINPVLGTSEPTPTLTMMTDTAADPVQLTSVALRQASNTAGATYGGFKVGKSWADITPSSATTPTLTADGTSNTVDNSIDITFTDDSAWRTAVTAVKIGTTTLTSGTDYDLTAGNLQLKPSGLNVLLTTPGSKSVTVVATGYTDATVTQVINAGAPTTNSTATISAALAPNTSRTITCTAKDQYNNLVSGYTFAYDVTLTNNNSTTAESYTINSSPFTATSTSGNSLSTTTNASGVATFTAALPATIDPSDGISVQAQLNDDATNVGSAFTFAQLASQTITFGSLSTVTYGDTTFGLTATASSTLPVSYTSSNIAVATVTGSTVTIVGAGSTNITVSQAGNGSYNAAEDVIQELRVNAIALTIPDAAATSKVYTGTDAAVITGNLVGIINSDNITLIGTGTFADVNVADGIAVTSNCTLAGTKAGNYSLTQPTGLTANITQASQTITFGVLANKTTVDSPFALLATASSALAVTYVSSNTAVATVSGSTVTIVGAGSTTFTASQIGDANYAAATPVDQVLLVNPVVYLNQFTGIAACPTNGNLPSVLTNVSGTSLTRNTITCTTLLNQFNSTTLNNSASINDASYIEFSASAGSGYRLNLTSLSFYRQGSGTAPNSLEVRYSTDGFATSTSWGAAPVTPASGTVATWDFVDFSSANGGTVTFRIYPYGTQRADLAGTAALSTGTFRLDDITINGNITAVTTWTGSAWTSGAPTSSLDAIISGNLATSTDLICDDLTINSGMSLEIGAGNKLTVSGNLINNGTLIFKSNATNTAMFDVFNGSQSGNGLVTVERYIPLGKRAFRFLTPSVTTTSSIYTNWQIDGATTTGRGTHITGSTSGANGFDVTASGNPSMFTYENNVASGTGWLAIPNTNATALTAGMGYRTLVRGDRNVNISVASTDDMNVATTLSATGTLKVGNVVFDGTTTPVLNSTANTTTNGYSLIGNPYASPVDWELVSRTDVDVSYYAWDPNMGTAAERGRYVAYSASTHQATNSGTGTSRVSQFIQPGQAFFVKTIGASPSLTFKEADKASTFTNVFRTIGNSSLSVSVYNPSEVAFASPIDATIAVFAADFDASVGYGDVEKLYSSGEHLAWSRGTKLLAMDATTPVVTSDELLLKTMQFSANKSYTFKVNTTNFDSSLRGYLVDQYLNSQTLLDFSTSNFITFATTTDAASYGADRFKVVFNSSALNNEEWNTKSLRIYPNPVVDNQFTIAVSPSIADKVTICIYNMIGQSVYRESATAINNSIVVHPSAILKAGVYMVEMTNNGKTSTQKIIIK